MLCTLSPCYMPEGMKVRGSGGLAQPPPLPHKGLYIWLAMAWQVTLDLRAIDSAARDSASLPCAQELDLIPKVSTFYSHATTMPCHNKLIQSSIQ
jgi:hypothetical protein